ncbi:fluoride efflux transporter CrcB [Niallia oryzisoli]|uniref:fluoride efflux transporter CrcB n=1 Tax=Niallia oryzisoli TaxID=1737571 RepID=UPI003736E7AB
MIWLIGIGGSLGSAIRFLLSSYIKEQFQNERYFPLGTWMINVSGSFILGILTNLHLTERISEWIWFLLGVGFCGAYTTFSTFGYEVITLIVAKKEILAILYVITSVIAGILAASIGFLFVNFV